VQDATHWLQKTGLFFRNVPQQSAQVQPIETSHVISGCSSIPVGGNVGVDVGCAVGAIVGTAVGAGVGTMVG
jgi:hypothetical protein